MSDSTIMIVPEKDIAVQTSLTTDTTDGTNDRIELFISQDYQLNRSNALKKKLDACSRPVVEIAMQRRNNLTIGLSTQAFEYTRYWLYHHMARDNAYVLSKPTYKLDTLKSVESFCYKVSQKDSKTFLFTVNVYNTTSRIMVNGSSLSVFISNVLPLLQTELENSAAYIKQGDNYIKTKLKQAVSAYESIPVSNNSKALESSIKVSVPTLLSSNQPITLDTRNRNDSDSDNMENNDFAIGCTSSELKQETEMSNSHAHTAHRENTTMQ